MAHRFGDKALSGKFVRYGTPRRGLSTMIRLIWNLSVRTRLLLRAWMPTNILLDAIRTRACYESRLSHPLITVMWVVAWKRTASLS